MHCQYCGGKIVESHAVFCPYCGKKLTKEKASKKPYILPAIAFFLFTILIIIIYQKEMKVNQQVLELQKKAEEAALNGDYQTSLKYFEQAQEFRENVDVIEKELDHVSEIVQYDEELDHVSKLIMEKDYKQAEQEVYLIEEKLQENSTPLFQQLSTRVEDLKQTIKVSRIKDGIDNLTSVEELADKLQTVSLASLVDSKEVEKQIKTRMVIVSATQAEESLERKHFNKALTVVNEALQYAVNNQKLLALREKIYEEKKAFEEQETKRIESAKAAAKAEEKENRTNAVKVEQMDITIDEFGDAQILGMLVNKGTKDVHSITIEFVVKTKDGKMVEQGKTNVSPNTVHPGESAKFQHITYEVNEPVDVEIKKISWYLDEEGKDYEEALDH